MKDYEAIFGLLDYQSKLKFLILRQKNIQVANQDNLVNSISSEDIK